MTKVQPDEMLIPNDIRPFNDPLETDLGYYFYAVLDIMGMRDRLMAAPPVVHDLRELQGAFAVVAKCGDQVQFLLTEVARWCNHLYRRTPHLRGVEYKRLRRHATTAGRGVSIFQLGDSVGLAVRFFNKDRIHGRAAMYHVSIALLGVAATFLSALGRKLPVRGAISAGVGAEMYNQVLGTVSCSAHLAEQHAGHMRICVVDRFRFLVESALNPKEEGVEPLERELANSTLGLITNDASDQREILDYLSPAIASLPELAPLRERFVPARSFLQQEMMRFRRADDGARADRYTATLRYFASKAKAWTSDPNS